AVRPGQEYPRALRGQSPSDPTRAVPIGSPSHATITVYENARQATGHVVPCSTTCSDRSVSGMHRHKGKATNRENAPEPTGSGHGHTLQTTDSGAAPAARLHTQPLAGATLCSG